LCEDVVGCLRWCRFSSVRVMGLWGCVLFQLWYIWAYVNLFSPYEYSSFMQVSPTWLGESTC
jgi:hypothetical protein